MASIILERLNHFRKEIQKSGIDSKRKATVELYIKQLEKDKERLNLEEKNT